MDVNWIDLVGIRDRWRTVMKAVMNLLVKFCVYHPGVFTELNKISQFQSNTPFVFIIII